MFAKLALTGKRFYVTSNAKHGINCIVNGIDVPFTMTDDEIHAFGLYSYDNKLLGYFSDRGLVPDLKEAVHTDGFMVPYVKDGPAGCYVKSVSTYYSNYNGGYASFKTLH